ncbi:deleted in malignant brain tumors 1 protein-like [Strongylocentrotus purpuratus]|uniref:SRCR domain-containing protein n=1 Tax=Strongylocentrotus purpuratus TaxID=7668 RepID=A0A7M7NRE2_STRPU|nr:deleted in malignant brain tumors 1 protein-like [Strongylocentrotus purpuratus]
MKEPDEFRIIEPLRTRLFGGSGSFEGRVEVYYQGAWGTVCDDGWDLDDAHVVCRTFGYSRASAFYHSANFGEGTGEIILDDVNCEGSESNIAFCQHSGYLTHNCGHTEDAGVTCDGIEPLRTRLVGGSGSFEGRVEVYYQGAWGTVCDDGWDLDDAHVVCHTLGYPRASAYNTNANFGEGTGEIMLDDVTCEGSESNIAFCQHRAYLTHNCGHAEDAGVTCDGIAALIGVLMGKPGVLDSIYKDHLANLYRALLNQDKKVTAVPEKSVSNS